MNKNCTWWFTVLYWIRPVIAHRYFGIFGFWFFLYYFLFRNRDRYNKLYGQYREIRNTIGLIDWFKKNYKYKYDLLKGFFDHDNSKYEFFTDFGDCDDAALYARDKLREFGINAHIIYMIDNTRGMQSGHFDCIYQFECQYVLFNYADPICGTSVQDCMDRLCKKWYAEDLSKVQWITKLK